MSEIQRPGALYRQVAADIRDAIASGDYPPGTLLPSETQLIERYRVSRPTVRNAVAALRAEGLIEVIHGKGSFVRSTPTPVLTLDRAVTRTSTGTFETARTANWQAVEDPHVYRTKTTASTGTLLNLGEDEALFGIDQLLTRPGHRHALPPSDAHPVHDPRGSHPRGAPGRRIGRRLHRARRGRPQAVVVRDRPSPRASPRRTHRSPTPRCNAVAGNPARHPPRQGPAPHPRSPLHERRPRPTRLPHPA